MQEIRTSTARSRLTRGKHDEAWPDSDDVLFSGSDLISIVAGKQWCHHSRVFQCVEVRCICGWVHRSMQNSWEHQKRTVLVSNVKKDDIGTHILQYKSSRDDWRWFVLDAVFIGMLFLLWARGFRGTVAGAVRASKAQHSPWAVYQCEGFSK